MATTYTLSTFDEDRAAAGELCALVSRSYTNFEITDEDDNFVGIGICKKTPSGKYVFTYNSIPYTFSSNGASNSNSAIGYKLMLAKTSVTLTTTGNAIQSRKLTLVTRSIDESITVTETDEENTKIIDSLSVRDQFAMQALRGILEHVADPISISDSEMSFYCNAAYQWAANMMTKAADTRSTLDDETSSTTTTTEEVGTLDSNTEKLLNNIIVAIEDTNTKLTALSTTVASITSELKNVTAAIKATSGTTTVTTTE